MINTKEKLQKIKIPKLNFNDLNLYNIYTIEKIDKTTNNNETRLNKLLEILKLNKAKNKLDEALRNLCIEYADIFALETDKMTKNNFYEQKLKIKDDDPVYTNNYRTAQTQKEEIKMQVNKLIQNDLIEKSTSCYNSPIILLPKKESNIEKNGECLLTIEK